MKRSRRSLVLQAALIVLPVVVLSGISLYFLREDRGAIERDARDQAQRLVPQLARELATRLAETFRTEAAGEIGRAGEILSPADYPRLPEPPDWLRQLSPVDAAIWAAAQTATFQRKDPQAARQAFARLSTSGASAAARLNAELGLLRLDANGSGMVRQAIDLARRSSQALTESGTPVADLALLIALRRGPLSGELSSALEKHVREQPSFLTPELLEAAGGAARDLRAFWSDRERTLAMLRILSRHPLDAAAPAETWIDTDGQPHLALTNPSSRGWLVTLVPESFLRRQFQDFISANHERIPPYASAALEIGGARIPGGARKALLGSAEETSPHRFTLSLDLAAPDLLYSGYRRRLWLTAGLILSAAAAALLSMASFWRGFRRQVRLNEMKSDFVSSVSHELRAPIAAVQLMAESLERGRITDLGKQQDYYHLIVQQCRRLSAMVENVLDFSRIDRGSRQYRFEPVDAVALVRRTVALMEPCAAARDVHVALVEPDAGTAGLRPCWDDHAVEQTLVNLLDNAIKHSPSGSAVRVGIDVVPTGETIRVWVEDQGKGIPPDAQARIFELFYRHGTELRRETAGVGIGLSIVKHVAEAHRGRVMVESAVGQGSRFALELPSA